jgi:hypothetical protein
MNAAIDLHKLIPAWQMLQSAIEDESDYEQATALLNTLLDGARRRRSSARALAGTDIGNQWVSVDDLPFAGLLLR